MKASIIKIGNSHGLRIPKPIIKQCKFDKEVELEVNDAGLIIKPSNHSRQNWEKAFKVMAQKGDDRLIETPNTSWDEKSWEW